MTLAPSNTSNPTRSKNPAAAPQNFPAAERSQ
jgi:hypothetical protein